MAESAKHGLWSILFGTLFGVEVGCAITTESKGFVIVAAGAAGFCLFMALGNLAMSILKEDR